MHYKDLEKKADRKSRTIRPLAVNSPERIPLSNLVPGQKINGNIISLRNYGAYVDIGSECDGLLHISQISRKDFIEHPRSVFSAGDDVTVFVSRVSPELKKIQLTMLPNLIDKKDEKDYNEDRIPLDQLDNYDELWGEIKRVTNYGAYVEVAAQAEGWLHFMDHPEFGLESEAHPSTYLKTEDRIRCWVSGIDEERQRLKLTAIRPDNLPGPRREIPNQVTR